MTFLLLLSLMQAAPAPAAQEAAPAMRPNPEQNTWGPVENEYFHAIKDDITCGAPGPSCRDRVIIALGDLTVKSAGKNRKLKRGDIAAFGAGQSYELPRGDHFWEVVIKPDHPPVPSPPEVIPAQGIRVLHNAEDYYVYNERLTPGEKRPRHSHTMRAVVTMYGGVGGGGGAVIEWPKPAAQPAAKPQPAAVAPLKLTKTQQDAIATYLGPRTNDSIAFAGPVIHTNEASHYAGISNIAVHMKSADEKAGGKPSFDKSLIVK